MVNCTIYSPITIFANTQPNVQQPGDKLDQEFNAIQVNLSCVTESLNDATGIFVAKAGDNMSGNLGLVSFSFESSAANVEINTVEYISSSDNTIWTSAKIQNELTKYLKLSSGGTIIGPVVFSSSISLGGKNVTGISATGNILATESYVGSFVGDGYLPLTGGTLTGNLSVEGELSATENTTLSKDLAVGKDLSVAGNLTTTGTAVINGSVTINSTATISGQTTVGSFKFAAQTKIITGTTDDGTILATEIHVTNAIAEALVDYLPLTGGAITGNLTISGTLSAGVTTITGLKFKNETNTIAGTTDDGTILPTTTYVENNYVSFVDYLQTSGGNFQPSADVDFISITIPNGSIGNISPITSITNTGSGNPNDSVIPTVSKLDTDLAQNLRLDGSNAMQGLLTSTGFQLDGSQGLRPVITDITPGGANEDYRAMTVDALNEEINNSLILSTKLPAGYFKYGVIAYISPNQYVQSEPVAVDSTNTYSIYGSSNFLKITNAPWASGNGVGGLPSSLTLTPNTWYRTFILGKSNDITISDAGLDTDPNAVNLLADAAADGFDIFRQSAWIYIDGSLNIQPFMTQPHSYMWYSPQLSITGDIAAGLTTYSDSFLAFGPPDNSSVILKGMSQGNWGLDLFITTGPQLNPPVGQVASFVSSTTYIGHAPSQILSDQTSGVVGGAEINRPNPGSPACSINFNMLDPSPTIQNFAIYTLGWSFDLNRRYVNG